MKFVCLSVHPLCTLQHSSHQGYPLWKTAQPRRSTKSTMCLSCVRLEALVRLMSLSLLDTCAIIVELCSVTQSCCHTMDYSPPGSFAMGFSRQEYWSGLPCPPPGDLPNSGIEPEPLASSALADGFFTTSATW